MADYDFLIEVDANKPKKPVVPIPPDPSKSWADRQVSKAKQIGGEVADAASFLSETALSAPSLLAPDIPGVTNPVKDKAKANLGGLGDVLAGAAETGVKAVEGDPQAGKDVLGFFAPLAKQYEQSGGLSLLTEPVETAWNWLNTFGPLKGALRSFGAAGAIKGTMAAARGAGRAGEKLFSLLPEGPVATNLRTGAKAMPERAETLVRKVVPKHDYTPEMYNVEAQASGALHRGDRYATETGRDFQKLLVDNPAAAMAVGTVIDPTINSVELLHGRLKEAITRDPAKAGRLGTATSIGLDPNTGMLTYGDSAAYAALTPGEKASVDAVRSSITGAVLELHRIGGIGVDEMIKKLVNQVEQKYLADVVHTPGSRPLDTMPPAVRDRALDWIQKHGRVATAANKTAQPTTRTQAEEYLAQLLTPDGPGREPNVGNPGRSVLLSTLAHRSKDGRIPAAIEDALGPMRAEAGRTNWAQDTISMAPGEAGAMAVAQTLSDLNWSIQNTKAIESYKAMMGPTGLPLVLTKGDNPPTGYKKLHAGETAHGLMLKEGEVLYYHPSIQDSIEMIRGNHISGSAGTLLRLAKWGMVVPNVRTWANNMASNFQYGIIAGASMVNPKNWGHYQQAVKDISATQKGSQKFTDLYQGSTDPIFREAIDRGILNPQSIHTEMADIYGTDLLRTKNLDTYLEHGAKWLMENKGSSAVSRVYEAQDMVAKYGAYRTLRARGLDADAATAEVYGAFPTYGITSQLGRWLRGHTGFTIPGSKTPLPPGLGQLIGSPFASFPMEHTRIMTWAAKNHPARLAMAASLPSAMRGMAMAAGGVTREEWSDFNKGVSQDDPGITTDLTGGMHPARSSYIPNPAGWRKGGYNKRVIDITGMFATEQVPFVGAFSGSLPVTMGREIYRGATRTPGYTDISEGLSAGLLSVVPPIINDTVGSARHAIQGTQRNPQDSATKPPVRGEGSVGQMFRNLGQSRLAPVKIRKVEDLVENARTGAIRNVDKDVRAIDRQNPFDRPDKTDKQLDEARDKAEKRLRGNQERIR